jgi:hypothetical protein
MPMRDTRTVEQEARERIKSNNAEESGGLLTIRRHQKIVMKIRPPVVDTSYGLLQPTSQVRLPASDEEESEQLFLLRGL